MVGVGYGERKPLGHHHQTITMASMNLTDRLLPSALRRRATARALLITALVCVAAQCREHPSGAAQRTVHISAIAHGPYYTACGGRTDITYDLQFNVTVVNTTADTVRVQRVSSQGVYLAAGTRPGGAPGLGFDALPFSPLTLVPTYGEGTTVAHIRGNCPPASQYGEIQVTILVHTSAGVFASPAVKVAFGL